MDVNKCTNVGDIGIPTIAEAYSTSLRTLKLLDCYKLGYKSILAVVNLCKKPTFALSFESDSNDSRVVAVESDVVVLSLQDGVKSVEQHDYNIIAKGFSAGDLSFGLFGYFE
ncbi:hypothetical protein Tco_1172354, partial [Tanacetum coccineum]